MFGSPRTGKEPIVLLLSTGHYQLARLKPGRQWPKEWTSAEPAEVNHGMLRAGGGTRDFGTPAKSRSCDAAWRCENTPASVRSTEKGWRVENTPASSSASSRRGRRERHDSWRLDATPASTAKKQKVCLSDTPCSSAGLSLEGPASSSSSKPKQGRPAKSSHSRQDKGRAQDDFPDETKPAADGFFHWKCHVCFERRKSETKDRLRAIKRTHRSSKHPEIPWKDFLVRPFIPVLEARKTFRLTKMDGNAPTALLGSLSRRCAPGICPLTITIVLGQEKVD